MKLKNRGRKRLNANVGTNLGSPRRSSYQRGVDKRANPHQKTMKETFWSKLRELWAIRQRCREIKLQQRQNRPQRANEFSTSLIRRNSPQITNLSG